ncbi:MAG: transposase [Acidobacteriota bacterium]
MWCALASRKSGGESSAAARTLPPNFGTDFARMHRAHTTVLLPGDGWMLSVLKQAEAGARAADLCRQVGISQQTLYRWSADNRVVRSCFPGPGETDRQTPIGPLVFCRYAN